MKIWSALFFLSSIALANAKTDGNDERSSSIQIHQPRSHIVSIDKSAEDVGRDISQSEDVIVEERPSPIIHTAGREETTEATPGKEPAEDGIAVSERNEPDTTNEKNAKRHKESGKEGSPSFRETNSSPGAMMRMLDSKYSDVKVSYPEEDVPWWKRWWINLTSWSFD